MSYRMACERADLIAGVMSLAGNAATTPSNCTPSQPVSVLHLHGTADGTVPFAANGMGAEPSVTQWATHDGCGTTRSATVTLDLDTQVTGSETSGQATSGCPGNVGVELWTMTDSGHIPLLVDTFATTVFDWLSAHKR